MFGQTKPYNFNDLNMEVLRKQTEDLQNETKVLKKKANPKAVSSLERYIFVRMFSVGRRLTSTAARKSTSKRSKRTWKLYSKIEQRLRTQSRSLTSLSATL